MIDRASSSHDQDSDGEGQGSGSGRRVLVVDDDELVAQVSQQLLEMLGHHVDVTTSGHEALELASSQAYELIVIDYHMPEIDGIETARRLRQSATTGAPELVLMTGDMVSKRPQETGLFAAQLEKPFRLADLERLIEVLFSPSSSSSISEGVHLDSET